MSWVGAKSECFHWSTVCGLTLFLRQKLRSPTMSAANTHTQSMALDSLAYTHTIQGFICMRARNKLCSPPLIVGRRLSCVCKCVCVSLCVGQLEIIKVELAAANWTYLNLAMFPSEQLDNSLAFNVIWLWLFKQFAPNCPTATICCCCCCCRFFGSTLSDILSFFLNLSLFFFFFFQTLAAFCSCRCCCCCFFSCSWLVWTLCVSCAITHTHSHNTFLSYLGAHTHTFQASSKWLACTQAACIKSNELHTNTHTKRSYNSAGHRLTDLSWAAILFRLSKVTEIERKNAPSACLFLSLSVCASSN